MDQTVAGLAGLAGLIALAPIVFFIFTVVVMILVVIRLRRILEQLEQLNRQMMAIRFPNLPWPLPLPDQILTTDWRNGVLWRMRGDGRWEHHRGLTWKEATHPSDHGRDARR